MILPVPATFAEIRAAFERAQVPSTSWAAVAEAFAWVDVEIGVVAPDRPAWGMPFLVALRGALGRQLREEDLDDVPERAEDQPSAARLLFYSMGRMGTDFDFPKPFVLQADPSTGTLRIRLFGPAMMFATELAGALARVASQRVDNPFGAPVEVTARRIAQGGLESVGLPDARSLSFVTPLVMRRGQQSHYAPEAVLRGLLRRVSGILAWQGLGLPGSLHEQQTGLGDCFDGARWQGGEPVAARWDHPSARQGRIFEEKGVTGRLLLGADLGPFRDLFGIGQVVHSGAKAAIGCGRFRLSE